MLKKLFLPLLAVAALLAACGGDDRSFNSADVEFAQGMIPHHEQAVGMATLALTTADKPEVLDLAKRIQLAQDPEIATMQDWLKDWGKGETTEGMDHGATDMGMMSEQEMTSLQSASGADFDRMFVEMMVRHHNGAIDMAATELSDGKSADAKKLARAIIAAQRAEIEEMTALQPSLGRSEAADSHGRVAGCSGGATRRRATLRITPVLAGVHQVTGTPTSWKLTSRLSPGGCRHGLDLRSLDLGPQGADRRVRHLWLGAGVVSDRGHRFRSPTEDSSKELAPLD